VAVAQRQIDIAVAADGDARRVLVPRHDRQELDRVELAAAGEIAGGPALGVDEARKALERVGVGQDQIEPAITLREPLGAERLQLGPCLPYVHGGTVASAPVAIEGALTGWQTRLSLQRSARHIARAPNTRRERTPRREEERHASRNDVLVEAPSRAL